MRRAPASGTRSVGAAWKVPGGGWVARSGVRTEADGRFVYLLPPGPSRAVRFTYFAFSDSRAVELSNVVHVDVHAPLTIRADRGHVTGERIVRLSGRVGGGSIPRRRGDRDAAGLPARVGLARLPHRADRPRGTLEHPLPLPPRRPGASAFARCVPQQSGFPFATTRSAAVFVVVS